jgi:hypothetical protein
MTHAKPAIADVPSPSERLAERRWHLPRRDFVLLPLIFVMTIVTLLVGGEAAARLIYVQADDVDRCLYSTTSGPRHRPFCSSRDKVWDGPWVTQVYNACGYRTAEPCTPRPPGALRVVVLGSSVAQGSKVDYAESFAARSSAALSDECGASVDFQNLASSGEYLDRVDLRIPEALALRPSAIVMMIGVHDVMHLKEDPPPEREQAERPGPFNLHAILTTMRDSRLVLVIEGQLYKDTAFHVRGFLLRGDAGDYVRSPLSEQWRQRVTDLGDLLGRITALTAPAQVPVLLFYFPERPQAALAAEASARPGIDPLALGEALGAEAAKQNVRFFDTTRAFAEAPDFQSLYYVTDGHPRPPGHAVLATVVQQALLSEPTFARCSRVVSSP